MTKPTVKYKQGSPEQRAFLASIAQSGGLATKKRKLAEEPGYYSRISKAAHEKRYHKEEN
jgi:hypothetical protein